MPGVAVPGVAVRGLPCSCYGVRAEEAGGGGGRGLSGALTPTLDPVTLGGGGAPSYLLPGLAPTTPPGPGAAGRRPHWCLPGRAPLPHTLPRVDGDGVHIFDVALMPLALTTPVQRQSCRVCATCGGVARVSQVLVTVPSVGHCDNLVVNRSGISSLILIK